jgi:hypothetical protein
MCWLTAIVVKLTLVGGICVGAYSSICVVTIVASQNRVSVSLTQGIVRQSITLAFTLYSIYIILVFLLNTTFTITYYLTMPCHQWACWQGIVQAPLAVCLTIPCRKPPCRALLGACWLGLLAGLAGGLYRLGLGLAAPCPLVGLGLPYGFCRALLGGWHKEFLCKLLYVKGNLRRFKPLYPPTCYINLLCPLSP